MESKTVIPYSSHGDVPTANLDREWVAAVARRRLRKWAEDGGDWDPEKYKKGFVFIDGDSSLLGSYKGIHHDIIDGNLVAVWSGVKSAMGSLVYGSRGGRIEDDDNRKSVYNHLAKHYEQFNKPVPNFRGDGAEFFSQVVKPEELDALESELRLAKEMRLWLGEIEKLIIFGDFNNK